MLHFDDIKILFINFSKKLSKHLKIKYIYIFLMKMLINNCIVYHYCYNFIVVNT
jgi:hypothetical protein